MVYLVHKSRKKGWKAMDKLSRKRFNVPQDDIVVNNWWKAQTHPSVALRTLIKHHVASCGGQIFDTLSIFDELFKLNGINPYPAVEGEAIPDKAIATMMNTSKETPVVPEVKKETPKPEPKVEFPVEVSSTQNTQQVVESNDDFSDMDAIFGR